ncbi:MAG: TIGR04086 family membrane protein [Firmicutes bacterium]|nr:TIGR04086 family membrane protein [Bacillota bacterium]
MTEKLIRIGKGYLLSLAVFAVLTALGAVLMKITPFPESWGFCYVIAAMGISCLFVGLYISSYFQKSGLLTGLCCSAVLLACILALVSACFSKLPNMEILKPAYLLPLCAGVAGGILGANMKK